MVLSQSNVAVLLPKPAVSGRAVTTAWPFGGITVGLARRLLMVI